MPELPEVETVVRELRSLQIIGRNIKAVALSWPRLIRPARPQAFVRSLTGRRIRGVARRGKYIVITLSGRLFLLIHLRMTGRLSLAKPCEPDKHQLLSLLLSDGRELCYHDVRKFGRWYLTTDSSEILGKLGPDALAQDFTLKLFLSRLANHKRKLKPLLLDQSFLAGLGNIYTDEALWEARLHPLRRSDTLSKSEAKNLHLAIRKVLRRAVAGRGTTLGTGDTNFRGVTDRRGNNQLRLKVFRRTGDACPRCRNRIRRMIVGQRGTHFCPACQTV